MLTFIYQSSGCDQKRPFREEMMGATLPNKCLCQTRTSSKHDLRQPAQPKGSYCYSLCFSNQDSLQHVSKQLQLWFGENPHSSPQPYQQKSEAVKDKCKADQRQESSLTESAQTNKKNRTVVKTVEQSWFLQGTKQKSFAEAKAFLYRLGHSQLAGHLSIFSMVVVRFKLLLFKEYHKAIVCTHTVTRKRVSTQPGYFKKKSLLGAPT